jgi:hypothetical protein
MTAVQRNKLASNMKVSAAELEPLNADEMDSLAEAFRLRLGHVDKLPTPGQANFSDLYFSSVLVLEGYVFPDTVWFPNVHYTKAAYFASARFLGVSFFQGGHFNGLVDFGQAEFSEIANFATDYFAGHARFSFCHFFESSLFASTVFMDGASFSNTKFDRSAYFGDAIFHAYVNFDFADFLHETNFDCSRFLGMAHFSNGVFQGTTSFSMARFEWQVPDFFQRQFHDNTKFTARSDDWPKVDPDDAQTAKDAYRRLRQVSSAQHNPENEHFFLRQEMACDAVLKEDWISRFVVRAFGWISDYGYSVWRPIGGLAAAWIGGALALQCVFAWYYIFGWPLPGEAKHVPELMEAIWLGLSNTFAIFGFRTFYFGEDYMQNLPTFVKFIGGAQTILGFIFLFFLGLGLRNRFRLK